MKFLRHSKWLWMGLGVYLVLITYVLSVSLYRPQQEVPRFVSVNITDFRPPEIPELTETQREELAEIDAQAKALFEQTST